MSATKDDPVTEQTEETVGVEAVDLPALLPNAEYDADMSLAAREEKWGFTLEELRGASKVVRTLFLNPALFVGDPYLGDSRLYTMITRDRQKKREHRETYKAIMNEEKSRRKKYLRSQNQSALMMTIMKREREDALRTLLLQDTPPASPLLLTTGAREGEDDADASSPVGEVPTATQPDPGRLSDKEMRHLRWIGAFENVLRLERCLAGVEHFESTFARDRADGEVGNASAAEQGVTLTTGESSTTEAAKRGAVVVDWAAASQLTAQVYRYMPHPYGSQMPPPLLAGSVPPTAEGREQLQYIRGFKMFLARQVATLTPPEKEGTPPSAKRARTEEDGKSPSSPSLGSTFTCLSKALEWCGSDSGDGEREIAVIVVAPSPGSEAARAKGDSSGEDFTSVQQLRELFSSSPHAPPLDSVAGAGTTLRATSTTALLDAIEAALLQGRSGVNSEFWTPPQPPSSDAAGREAAITRSAESSLNLFLARRLYGNVKLRGCGASPVVVDRVPPTSASEEPDVWNAFDDVQLYATDHHDGDGLLLSNWRGCNICKVRFNRLHPYYYSMCHLCGEFNYNKRLLTRDLRGKVVLLTGCRIKIGFVMALSLLRCGATVLGTTRFAHEAVARFQQEVDYDAWKDRLHLYSLDMRDLWVVTQFCGFVLRRFPKIFAIINNAAQTIARTPQYTEHLRQIEIHPAPELRDAIKRDATADEWNTFFLRHTSVTVGEALSIEHRPAAQPFLPVDGSPSGADVVVVEVGEGKPETEEVGEEATPVGTATMAAKAATATAVATPTGIVDHLGNAASTTLVFDRYDTQAEESDHREANSWVMNLGEVEGSEAAEVMAINALAPFILNSKLKPCLVNREGDATPGEARFIINVSAMEGQFYRFKQTTHPHTNMAKAALNMMTRTSARDYAEDGIFMNSVDTGWITDESPKVKKERRAENYLLCPLDEVDAAARCLDLIYTDCTAHGHFYKDFKPIPW